MKLKMKETNRAMSCSRCGKCCRQGPCMINRDLKDKITFKFIKDEIYFGKFRPLLNNIGVCRYLKKSKDGLFSCPIIEASEDFRKHMDSGRCAFRDN